MMISYDELQRIYDDASERYARLSVKAFKDATRGLDIGAIREAVARGDAEAIVDLLHVDAGHLAPMGTALGAYFANIGARSMAGVKKGLQGALPRPVKALDFQFAPGNLRAMRTVATQTSVIFDFIRLDQIKAVQTMLVDGILNGEHPWTTARRITGNISKLTGRRSHSIIGFGEMHTRWWMAFERDVRTPEGRKRLFRRASKKGGGYRKKYNLINKSSWNKLGKLIREGREPTARELKRLLDSYHNNVMMYRGRAIARTEMLFAQNAAQEEAVNQMIDAGALKRELVMKKWRAGLDERTRETHRAANGQEQPMDVPFTVGGAFGMYPGAQTLPAGERINCRCIVQYDLPFAESL